MGAIYMALAGFIGACCGTITGVVLMDALAIQSTRRIAREEIARARKSPDDGHRILMHELRRLDPENPRLRFIEEGFRGW